MATYLLTWNPDRFRWTDLPRAAKRISEGKTVEIQWSTGNTKAIQPNDEIVFLQQGNRGRGIIASGVAVGSVFQEPHFEPDRAARGEYANYVKVRIDRLIDPDAEPHRRLDVDNLRGGALRAVNWATQSSGIKIESEAAQQLRRLWSERSGGIPEGITRTDILTAIADLDRDVSHNFGDSTGYNLIHLGKAYPPKAVVGLAGRRLAGRTLTPYDFRGGAESKCFKLLRKAGFEIQKKQARGAPTLEQRRNPRWTRDELILALDLYFRVNPLQTSETHPEIVALSDLLNRLPIHPRSDFGESFRNPNGVYMKLCNFLRFDPSYSGDGLTRGGKLEEEVWQEFADRKRLSATAAAIRANHHFVGAPATEEERLLDENEEFAEGRVLTLLHKRRERNPKLVRKKKAQVRAETGTLACEACGFDFRAAYGVLGDGFAECHHRKPVSELQDSQTTKLKDVAIVCSNCHRMLHRSRPWKTVEQMRNIVEEHRVLPS